MLDSTSRLDLSSLSHKNFEIWYFARKTIFPNDTKRRRDRYAQAEEKEPRERKFERDLKLKRGRRIVVGVFYDLGRMYMHAQAYIRACILNQEVKIISRNVVQEVVKTS